MESIDLNSDWDDENDNAFDNEEGRRAADFLRRQLDLFPDTLPKEAKNASFGLEIRNLKQACKVVNSIIPSSALEGDNLDRPESMTMVEVFPGQGRLIQRSRGLACAVRFPLSPGASGIPIEGLRFNASTAQLHRLAQLQNLVMSCRLDPERQTLALKLDETRLKLTTFSSADHKADPLLAPDKDQGTEFDTRALKQALAFVGRFAPKTAGGMPRVVEVANGIARAGQPNGIAVCESDSLGPINFRTTSAHYRKVCSALSCFSSRSKLLQTKDSFIIYDDLIVLSVEKPTERVPDISRFLEAPVSEAINLAPDAMTKSIYIADIVLGGIRGAQIELAYEADPGTLTITGKHKSIGTASYVIPVTMAVASDIDVPSWSGAVELTMLKGVLWYFSNVNSLKLGTLEQNNLVLDMELDNGRARAFLSMASSALA